MPRIFNLVWPRIVTRRGRARKTHASVTSIRRPRRGTIKGFSATTSSVESSVATSATCPSARAASPESTRGEVGTARGRRRPTGFRPLATRRTTDRRRGRRAEELLKKRDGVLLARDGRNRKAGDRLASARGVFKPTVPVRRMWGHEITKTRSPFRSARRATRRAPR